MQFSVGQPRKLPGKATFEQRSEGSEELHLTSDEHLRQREGKCNNSLEAGTWEHSWAPVKENRGHSAWSGMSEGTMAGDEVREVGD